MYDDAYFQRGPTGEAAREQLEFLHRFKALGRLIDVGCGPGFFLEAAAKAGWECTGVEIAESAAERARVRSGADVLVGDASDVHLPPASCDAVTFWHSIEHLPNPLAALKRARRWLKPDGVLIVRVVNCEGFDARMLGTAWTGWALPFHLFHFGPKSLDRLLKAAGFLPTVNEATISTLPLRFLFAPIAIPSHHAKIAGFARRRAPALPEFFRKRTDEDRFPFPIMRKYLPGREMTAVARPLCP